MVVIIIALFSMIYGICLIIKEVIIQDILYSDYYKLKLLRNIMKEYRLINMNTKSLIYIKNRFINNIYKNYILSYNLTTIRKFEEKRLCIQTYFFVQIDYVNTRFF